MEHSKNDESIKGGSSGIHLTDANSSPCLQFVYKRRESVSTRLLTSKTRNNSQQSDTALVSSAGKSRVYRHKSRDCAQPWRLFNLQLT